MNYAILDKNDLSIFTLKTLNCEVHTDFDVCVCVFPS